MARKEGKKAKGAGAKALASVAVTLRVTTTPAALNAPLQGAMDPVPNSMLNSPQVQPTLRRNQEQLYSFLERHSPYFRSHSAQIRSATSFCHLKNM